MKTYLYKPLTALLRMVIALHESGQLSQYKGGE